MIRLTVIYGTPANPAAFDAHYRDVHIPLARAMPGLKGFEVSQGGVAASAGDAPYLIALLSYADEASLHASLASPEGQKAVADVVNFATGGCTIYTTQMSEML